MAIRTVTRWRTIIPDTLQSLTLGYIQIANPRIVRKHSVLSLMLVRPQPTLAVVQARMRLSTTQADYLPHMKRVSDIRAPELSGQPINSAAN